MTRSQFADKANLSEMTEVDRVSHLAFFEFQLQNKAEFCLTDVRGWLDSLHLGIPNFSRLGKNLSTSRAFIKGNSDGCFRLHRETIQKLTKTYPDLGKKSQDIVDLGTILPAILYEGTPGYLQSLAKQVNASYECNIFDGAAVLMRRMEEVLLILSYENLGISAEIRGQDNNYFLLEKIVANAVANPKLALSRTSKVAIETFRKLGNYSAHKVTYTCKREYIAEKIDDYRALIDELLHKAGLKA